MPDPAPPNPTPADLTGRTLGDYQILRQLGVGGMGRVYLARQLSLKREVALKLLRNDLTDNPTALKRFQAEAEAVARLNHANIVHIYEIREHDGLRYMALEYVDGRNLRDYLARKGPPDLPVSLSIIRQVASALQRAHEQGIVHRDVKPENILVTRKVEVKVTDFGLSRFFTSDAPAVNLTQSGVAVGTPLYMAPEQVQGRPVDHRGDLYSFGVTCYHLLAGEPPFRGATAFEVAIKHVHDHPRPLGELRPDLPPDLCGLVHKLMAKDPADRYQSARDVLRDLAKVREGLSLGLTVPTGGRPSALSLSVTNGVAVPPAPAAVAPLPTRWGRWVIAGLVCVLAAAGGVIVYARTHQPEPAAVPTPPSPGLPDVRLPERLTTARERELLAALKDRDTRPDEFVTASIGLGLLYLKERRLDDAEARFKKLAEEQLPGLGTQPARLSGRLGQAVVLAHRDSPQSSNELFEDVLRLPFPKAGKPADRFAIVYGFLLRHEDLFQAVSDALNRNAANLGVKDLTPPALERLRNPRGIGRRE